ncbi:hypothetical protein AMECASPLE_024712 [Ameca splendens]|uniref:Uncharacterized protein n=1 Tax=Ameca splendens TaxID=208324 RepID=A0ABV0XTP2_9TELE
MAPRKRGGGGSRGGLSFVFCCFNSNDHPEITYKLREDFALQSMEPALPMPGYDELDNMFSELVVRYCFCAFLLLFSCCTQHEALLRRSLYLVLSAKLNAFIYLRLKTFNALKKPHFFCAEESTNLAWFKQDSIVEKVTLVSNGIAR